MVQSGVVTIIEYMLYIALFIAVVGIISYWLDKKRAKGLSRVASELGFVHKEKPHPEPHKKYHNIKLFNTGRTRSSTNLLKGKRDMINIEVFDYVYIVGHGKHSSTWIQTVLAARIPGMDLPHFILGPEGFFSKIGQLFGSQDIDFESHQKLSDNYLLKGEDEDRIRLLFRSFVLDHLGGIEDRPNIEGCGDTIVIYHHDRLLSPEDTKVFIERAIPTIKLFYDASR